MPKRTRPRWGWTGVQKMPVVELSVEEVARLTRPLGVSGSAKIAEIKERLEDLGSHYLRWKMQDESGPTVAEQNAALSCIDGLAQELVGSLALLDTESERLLGEQFEYERFEYEPPGEMGWCRLHRDRQHFLRLASCAQWALKESRKKIGPRPMKSLPLLVGLLAELYEEVTGKRFTHTPYEKCEYRGIPLSAAGDFVRTFVKTIDSSASNTQISTAMARVIKGRGATTQNT